MKNVCSAHFSPHFWESFPFKRKRKRDPREHATRQREVYHGDNVWKSAFTVSHPKFVGTLKSLHETVIATEEEEGRRNPCQEKNDGTQLCVLL